MAMRSNKYSGFRWLAALAIAAAPVPTFAQSAPAANLLQQVADVTLLALPNSAISTVRGTGLQGPQVSRSTAPLGTITLWDELKPLAQQQNLVSGSQIVTINGVAQ